jgi:hypothetical protein
MVKAGSKVTRVLKHSRVQILPLVLSLVYERYFLFYIGGTIYTPIYLLNRLLVSVPVFAVCEYPEVGLLNVRV